MDVHHAVRTPTRPVASWGDLATALCVGVAFDIATFDQRPGLALAIVLLSVAVLARRSVTPTRQDDALIVAAAVFGVLPAVRAAPWLIGLDLLAFTACVALVVTPRTVPFSESGVFELIRRALALLLAAVRAPAFLLQPVMRAPRATRAGRARSVLRSVAVAGPILLLFAMLLASADSVFGSLITPGLPDFDMGRLAWNVGFVLLGAVGTGALLRAAAARADRDTIDLEITHIRPRMRRSDQMLLLAGIDVLFALFVAVQFAFLFGGGERVQVTPGLTYADYARTGFFQLIVVAALTVPVIVGTWDLGHRDDPAPWFRRLVTVMIALTTVILASAWMRLVLYEGRFGFTAPRLIAYATIAWIGSVLLIVLSAVWARKRARVVSLSIVTGLVVLLALNVIDAERFVAERNIARYRATGRVDAAYLGSMLGTDAVPATAAFLRELRPKEGAVLRAGLCAHARELRAPTGWRSANLAHARARAALNGAGLTANTCARS